MNVASPAHRVRHASICLGVIVSVLIFVPLAGCDLLDQWIAGYASAAFMPGTALIYRNVSCSFWSHFSNRIRAFDRSNR
jgi:hypothetical protein